jgi:transposase
MKPYPIELRTRIMAAVDAGGQTQEEVAERFQVSTRFIGKLLAQRRELRHIEPLAHGGGRKSLLTQADLKRLQAALAKRPDATREELRKSVRPKGPERLRASRWSIGRALRALGLTRKKEDLRGGRGG